MTTSYQSAGNLQQDAPSAEPNTPFGQPRMAEYPRIAEVLERLRAPLAASPAPPQYAAPVPQAPPLASAYATFAAAAPAVLDGPVPHEVTHAVVASSMAYDGVVLSRPGGVAPAAPEALAIVAAPLTPAQFAPEVDDLELSDAELDALIAEMSLREVAQQALRARMHAFGENRHQRSAYELVFLMLAFSVMVLITSPPLVQVALALHGSAPG